MEDFRDFQQLLSCCVTDLEWLDFEEYLDLLSFRYNFVGGTLNND